jgi:hypothetical protein
MDLERVQGELQDELPNVDFAAKQTFPLKRHLL